MPASGVSSPASSAWNPLLCRLFLQNENMQHNLISQTHELQNTCEVHLFAKTCVSKHMGVGLHSTIRQYRTWKQTEPSESLSEKSTNKVYRY